jgi:hypothetical protein
VKGGGPLGPATPDILVAERYIDGRDVRDAGTGCAGNVAGQVYPIPGGGKGDKSAFPLGCHGIVRQGRGAEEQPITVKGRASNGAGNLIHGRTPISG